MLILKIISIVFVIYFILIAATNIAMHISRFKGSISLKIRLFNDIILRKNSVRISFNTILILIGIYTIDWGIVFNNYYVLIIGIIYLPIMVLLTSPSLNYYLRYKYKIFRWIKFIFSDIKFSFIILIQTLEEELIWRCAFVFFMRTAGLPDILTMVVGSVLFFSIHLTADKKRIILIKELEFLIFSFLLYFTYIQFNSVFIVWGIHFFRNSYIKFNKYETGVLSV